MESTGWMERKIPALSGRVATALSRLEAVEQGTAAELGRPRHMAAVFKLSCGKG
jgi:hypothetical protein